MKIILAPDSFKGSLAAVDVARAMERAIKEMDTEMETVLLPVADGGEGTMESLVRSTSGEMVAVPVSDPLGRRMQGRYGIMGNGKTCVIEIAEASGLTLLAKEERCPLTTSTYGTGELILAALDAGFRQFIIGLGGSATNDGGAGMLRALGMKFLDQSGAELQSGGGSLGRLRRMDASGLDARLSESEFLIASDVHNPFIGKEGASFVFGPQKGASLEMVVELDSNLSHFADVIQRQFRISVHNAQGAGAAGGVGGAFQAFFPSRMQPGIDVVLDALQFSEKLIGADLVITGEGRSDLQTLSGKAPFGVATACEQQRVPVILISGSISETAKSSLSTVFSHMYELIDDATSKEEAIHHAAYYIQLKTSQAIKIFLQSR